MDPSHTRSPGDVEPPHGAPWDVPLSGAPLAFVDLEMTGLRVGEDRVVEICVERVRGEVLEARLDTLVDPQGVHGAEKVHGLSAALLASAPTFASIAGEVARVLDGAAIVAHGAAWDLAFLGDELRRVGLQARAPTHAIDTLVLCRRALHLHGYGLQNVASALKIPVECAHRAGADVRTMRAIWPTLIEA
ncbi:MAG: exonuclease domain-containing protein, partial [Polyangiales bacterium]